MTAQSGIERVWRCANNAGPCAPGYCKRLPGCGWSDPPPTPEWVWHRLMDVLDADNGYNHHWSCHDFNAAKEPITALIGSGFFRDDPQDLDGSFWQAASGEASERLAFFAGHNETLARLDEAVNEVFDGPAENPMHLQFNAAIDFAISCGEGQAFLEAWREGDWDTIRKEFPKFQGELPA